MTDGSEKTAKSQGREALKRWSAPARGDMITGLAFQLVAVGGWIAISLGVAISVGAAAEGGRATHGLIIAAIGVFVRAVCGWLAEGRFSEAGRKMVSAARGEVLDKISDSGAGLLLGATAGARTSQIIDRTAQLEGHAARWAPGIRLSVAAPLVILVAVAMQSWLAAALLLVSVLVLPVFIWLTASGTAAEARAQQGALDTLSGVFQARAAQAGLIRAFRAIGRETAVIAARAEDLRQRTLAILRVAFLSTAVLEFFASISIALVAVYVGFKLLGIFPFATGETLTLTEGLAALMLAPEFFAPIRRLSSLHHDRADAAAAAQFLSGWMDAQSTRAEPPRRLPETAPVIAFDGVSLAWPDGSTALQGLSFEAHPGKLVALTGPSGAGKSTCLLALLGHAQCVAGAITVDGRPLSKRESLSPIAAYARQTPWLMEGTLAENIAIARPQASREEIEAAATRVGLGGGAGGLDRPLARFGSGLSGGQRQRLALARAVLMDAPLILLDEPTAHLDADAEADLIALIRSLAPGRTILVASHSPVLVESADAVVTLEPRSGEVAHV
ncbi:thiol reductant ABC exporter subunit CydD [Henriciella aquimarina]|uniref:thiol reductant ABC exporter subunit CydD n=1 Tax=Henriciella aquimarina TaxID=545261 RepID=UPI00117A6D9F|nr:thiol reductant ABC exporter subunit CydD [Henriciella aquimarina]